MPQLWLLGSRALAWAPWAFRDYDVAQGCSPATYVADGDWLEWHLVDPEDDLDAALEAAIEDGAEAWNAGPTYVNRGAEWEVGRAADRSDWSFGNGLNEVAVVDYSDLVVLRGFTPQTLALTAVSSEGFHTCAPPYSVDILFRDTDTDHSSVTWEYVTTAPSDIDNGDKSIGPVAAHEFGHALGLGHVTLTSVMGDYLAAEFTGGLPFLYSGMVVRLHEDDYVGLKALKPGSSTGKNFMIGRWRDEDDFDVLIGGTNPEPYFEVWNSTMSWTPVCAGDSVEASPGQMGAACPVGACYPAKIHAIVNGTGTYTVDMRWTLSNDNVCLDTDDIEIGTRSPTLSSNTPYLVGPGPDDEYQVPGDTPEGFYHVCAEINVEGALSEIESADNFIKSEALWYVQECP